MTFEPTVDGTLLKSLLYLDAGLAGLQAAAAAVAFKPIPWTAESKAGEARDKLLTRLQRQADSGAVQKVPAGWPGPSAHVPGLDEEMLNDMAGDEDESSEVEALPGPDSQIPGLYGKLPWLFWEGRFATPTGNVYVQYTLHLASSWLSMQYGDQLLLI